MSFSNKPKRFYCNKHSTEYSGYMCPECVQELANKSKSKDIEWVLLVCPRCQNKSLFHNKSSDTFECMNTKCGIKGKSLKEIQQTPQNMNSNNQKHIQITPNSKKEQVSITNTGIEIRHEGKGTKGSTNVPGYVYLVIDCSSSMEGNKLQQAKSGASNFARDALTKNYLTGLIKFDSHATLVFEPCKDILFIESRINTLDLGTTTNMEEAIYLSCDLLKGLSGPKSIVIVTDGMPNSPGDPQSTLKASEIAKSQQIDIIAIGTDDADPAFLKEIATRSELGMKVSSEKLEQIITSSVKLLPGNRLPEIKK